MATERAVDKATSAGDNFIWMLLLAVSILIFFVLPLSGGLGQLYTQGLRLMIAGIPLVFKLIHSVLSDQKPKSR